ncbi:helix-turn-helix domain-containing protein [Nocardia cyriacigeorgica]|uniref:helix-turn-helix domain-containing protein n=1 Tax=Nocardia cyriacigeorgica TaxID=135487 RepID=UPI0024557186|nr:helix-turn-helix domain-containing protein [Nocardia cyriacigeorgica]
MRERQQCRSCGKSVAIESAAGLCAGCARASGFRRPVPPGFFTSRVMRTALSEHDFGVVFAAIRECTGMSQSQLAALVGLSQARVSEVESGTRRLTGAKLVARISTVFAVPAQLLGFHVDTDDSPAGSLACEEVDWVKRRDFVTLTTAAALGSSLHPELERLAHVLPDRLDPVTRPRIGDADIDAIEAISDGFRRWDLAHGGGLCRSAALSQLHQVAALDDAICAPKVRARLQLATAELASMAGWLAYDIEDHNSARRLWTFALYTAQRAEDNPRCTDLMVIILLDMAHQALHLRRPKDGLAFCRLAAATSTTRRHPVSRITAGYVHTVTAWCWAALGEPDPTRRALADSRSRYAAVSSGTTPPWAWVVADAEIAAQHGHALHLLSVEHPEFAESAVAQLTAAANGHPAEHERSRAAVLPTLAVAHFQAGDIASAVQVGRDAVAAIAALSSQRCYARLRDLDSVAARRRSDPEVSDLRLRIDAALTE